MQIRSATGADIELLEDMLLAAYNWSGEQRFSRESLLDLDEARRYVDGWPGPGDLGVVAVDDDGTALGAAWARLLPSTRPGYGYVADDVPELSIGVAAGHRGRGVGRALLTGLLERARVSGHRRISLSVEPDNRAADLYRSLGFVAVGRTGGSDTMVLDLRGSDRSPPGATDR